MTDRNEQMLTEFDVAQLLKVSRKTVSRLADSDPDFPKPIKVGRGDRWTLGDIREWQQLKRLIAKAHAAARGPNVDTDGQTRTLGDSDDSPPSQPKKPR